MPGDVCFIRKVNTEFFFFFFFSRNEIISLLKQDVPTCGAHAIINTNTPQSYVNLLWFPRRPPAEASVDIFLVSDVFLGTPPTTVYYNMTVHGAARIYYALFSCLFIFRAREFQTWIILNHLVHVPPYLTPI